MLSINQKCWFLPSARRRIAWTNEGSKLSFSAISSGKYLSWSILRYLSWPPSAGETTKWLWSRCVCESRFVNIHADQKKGERKKLWLITQDGKIRTQKNSELCTHLPWKDSIVTIPHLSYRMQVCSPPLRSTVGPIIEQAVHGITKAQHNAVLRAFLFDDHPSPWDRFN